MSNHAGNNTTVTNGLKGMIDQGAKQVTALKERAVDVKDEVLSKAGTVMGRARKLIKANPVKSVLAAFGIGYLGMRILR